MFYWELWKRFLLLFCHLVFSFIISIATNSLVHNIFFNNHLQNHHHRVTGCAIACLVDCNNAIFEFRAFRLVLLCVVRYEARVNQSCFCLDCRCDILRRTIGTIPTLNVIRDNPSAVKGLFPIEKQPAIALLGRFKLSRLAGRGKVLD
jgi:hypothetical protein